MIEVRFIFRGPSIIQSVGSFFSKRHSLQMNSSTSLNSSLRAVTLTISLPTIHTTVFPLHDGQVRWASMALANHTRLLNRNVLSVSAPTGQTSITLPENSFSMLFLMNVEISETSPLYKTP